MSTHLPRHNILYVEDHEDTRELVSMILDKREIDVTTAQSVEEGTRLARARHFDLYLLDLWLPDGEGLELARVIRQFDPVTPIVFFSAAAFESDQHEAFEAGAQAYLIKPAVPSDLCNLIAALI
jgi:DNA-binding response OmpR family regulator